MATHSPLLMANPNAQLMMIEGNSIKPVNYKETPHYRLYKRFIEQPNFVERIFDGDRD
jgi:predicted ATPase